jgi:imidazolonepropionase-like amidohydrolase
MRRPARFLLFSLLCTLLSQAPARASDLALVGAKIYLSPVEPPLEDGTILVHDNQIVAVGPSASTKPRRFARSVTVIDCHGKTIFAGFWNSHVHILTTDLMHAENRSSQQLSAQMEQMFTRWGFTTVFDIASVLDNTNNIRIRISHHEILGPRILTVGEPFYGPGGTPVYIQGFLQENHIPLPEVASVSQAVERVRQQVRDGADGIKIFAGSIQAHDVLLMPADLAAAVVTEAHKAGQPVFAHPSNTEGIELALVAGVDILAHTTPMSGPWTPELTQRIKAAHMALIPTLTLFDVEGKKFGETPAQTEDDLNKAAQQLKSYSDAGGQILFGTDVGYTDHFDTSEEFTLMSRAGLAFQQILAALTTSPAERFGYASHSGHIANGMDADLVVLDADPAKDISAFSRVIFTIRQGKIIYRAH